MKARILSSWLCGTIWAVMTVAHVFAQNAPPPPPTVAPDAASTAALATNTSVPPHALPPASVVPVSAQDLSPAPNTSLSAGSSEIQSLTQAGLDQSVILAYITNSAVRFNLNPDHIILLQRAGVSSQVIGAMIQHDRALLVTAPPPTDPAPPTVSLAVPPPTPGQVPIIALDESGVGDFVEVDEGYSVAEQPHSVGPIRVPYPVKLNDPIVILRLPAFTVPYW